MGEAYTWPLVLNFHLTPGLSLIAFDDVKFWRSAVRQNYCAVNLPVINNAIAIKNILSIVLRMMCQSEMICCDKRNRFSCCQNV